MERFATFQPLTARSQADIGATFRRMSELLRPAKERGRIHFRIIDAGGRSDFTLELSGRSSKVLDRAVGKPTLEVLTKSETWLLIAEGALSPLEAFIKGKLRVRGDAEMGKRIVRQLAGSEGRVDICN